VLTPLAELNALDLPGFVAALDGVYERSPWVAEAAINAGPFSSRLDLLDALNAAMLAAPRDTQRALIDAYPELPGGPDGPDGPDGFDDGSADARTEWAAAGLDRLDVAGHAELAALTAAYRARHGFGFIAALRGHGRESLVAALAERLHNDDDHEFARALHEIGRIAASRLAARVAEPAGDEIVAMCNRLAWLSERKHALTCTALTPVHRATAALLRDWMLEAGLEAAIDALGNVVGRLRCGDPAARTLLVGSHYDTAIHAGPFDGRLGIVLPIVVARRLRLAGQRLPFDLEIVAFGDRHGQRFGAPFSGSSALAGQFDPMSLARRDADGITFAEALQHAGHDPVLIPALARDPARIAACLEIQTEQGPVLREQRRAVGVVSAILGLEKHLLAVGGSRGHAGSVPMALRRDAAAAVAECVLAAEALTARHAGVLATVGRLAVTDGAINAIADRCELSIDLRAASDAVRAAAAADLFAHFDTIAARRRVELSRTELETMAATPCAPALVAALADSVARVSGDPEVPRLPSGPRHDASMLARLAPMALLFVRVDEHGAVTADDAGQAAAAFADFLGHWRPG
jgi:allantoate deiminase/N-carbamoyl-L-amino-acid hydrolase